MSKNEQNFYELENDSMLRKRNRQWSLYFLFVITLIPVVTLIISPQFATFGSLSASALSQLSVLLVAHVFMGVLMTISIIMYHKKINLSEPSIGTYIVITLCFWFIGASAYLFKYGMRIAAVITLLVGLISSAYIGSVLITVNTPEVTRYPVAAMKAEMKNLQIACESFYTDELQYPNQQAFFSMPFVAEYLEKIQPIGKIIYWVSKDGQHYSLKGILKEPYHMGTDAYILDGETGVISELEP